MLGVVKIGGAFFSDPSEEHLKDLKSFISSFKGDLSFVAGGGHQTKKYLERLRLLNLTEGFLDYIGMELTHVNARVLSRLIGGKYCRSFPDVERFLGELPVTGGQVPGQSTDAVAAELADYLGADVLVLVKDVGGVYTSDPKKDPGARIIHKISFKDLGSLIKEKTVAGYYGVIDPQAILLIQRMEIPTYIVGPDFDFEKGTAIGKFNF